MSKDHLNDQLIPKPTDINIMAYKMKADTPKEHPYSSHISRFSIFPSFHSSYDSDTGVSICSQPDLNPLAPATAPDVTLLSKTKGGPYRHEILESHMKSRKKAAMWPGKHGFLHHTKPLKGECQVFYPNPPKTVFPNPKLCDWDWDLNLSKHTRNILKNLEQTHWISSYQMDYTGLGPTKLFKMEGSKEKRQTSSPVFVPSEPRDKCRQRHCGLSGRNDCSLTTAELPNPAASPPQNVTLDPGAKGHSESRCSSARARSAERRTSASTFREKENCKVHFDQNVTYASPSQNYQEAPPKITDTRTHQAIHNQTVSRLKAGRCLASGVEPHTDLLSRVASKEGFAVLPRSSSNSCIPPISSDIHLVRREGAAVGCRSSSLLDLQNSFSKSEAHRSFNSSVAGPTVDMRGNISTGKKHHFYGINCYYLHG
ncbi:uncharacterized protein C7orf31 [Thalassophryne amazonica]|uniref:uncharacterized protein C7orf31 n=1 Tax=Thalassophryne amazonica TaxID=390379 RepID=UPI001471C10E|nr:uncharacterized protein C7orf31 [Thalassophryne amazonica]